MDEDTGNADTQTILQFMTTEHFTLQGARSAVDAEITARLQTYVGTLSGMIVALALAAQVSKLGFAFFAFALVLLPVVYFLGVVTLGRLQHATLEWRIYEQGMNRIRHYYLEIAPHMKPYFVLPTTDDPVASMRALGMARSRWAGLLTAPAVVAVINSVVAGVFAALVGRLIDPDGVVVPSVAGLAGFVLSFAVLLAFHTRRFFRSLAEYPVAFPEESTSEEG